MILYSSPRFIVFQGRWQDLWLGCQGEPLPDRKPCKASNARSLSLRDMGFELGACACEETP